MSPYDIRRVMVLSAVKKGIRDIKDNPRRGLRNLVDLGEMRAAGENQHRYFRLIQRALQNEESGYYDLAKRIVKNTDEEALITFGMNFGYNALTLGAGKIREVKKTRGFAVPWVLLLESGSKSAFLGADAIRVAVKKGMENGIYCYAVFLSSDYPERDQLLSVINEEANAAFFIFMQPSEVNGNYVRGIKSSNNVFTVIDIDGQGYSEAIDLLQEGKCLYSCYVDYDDPGSLLERFDVQNAVDRLQLPVFVFVKNKNRLHSANGEETCLIKSRGNVRTNYLPIDLYSDIAAVDRNISREAHIVTICSDGTVEIVNMDKKTMNAEHNIHRESLEDIFRQELIT